MSDLTANMQRAMRQREGLHDHPEVTAYRVFHGRSEGDPGLVIERFGDVLTAQLHEGRIRHTPQEIRDALVCVRDQLGAQAVYRKHFVRDRAAADEAVEREHHSAEPWIGRPVDPEFPIVEYGLRLLIHPYDGFSVGLFLEHRENRRRVRELAEGRRVLNTFSYTCGFSVAAAVGGAVTVDSVDLHKRYLEWGKRNFTANGLALDAHRFFCSDVFDFYKRAKRQNRRYDLIVLDPPTFARMRRPKRTFELQRHLPDLCAGALELLEPGGIILLAVNDQRLSVGHLEHALRDSAAGRSCDIIERPSLPTDFAGDAAYSRAVMARFG